MRAGNGTRSTTRRDNPRLGTLFVGGIRVELEVGLCDGRKGNATVVLNEQRQRLAREANEGAARALGVEYAGQTQPRSGHGENTSG